MNNRIENSRVYRRVEFREPVQFQLKDPKHFGGCLSCDVSEGGLRVNLNEFVPIGSDITVSFSPLSQKTVECSGKVVWIRQLPYMDRYQVGLEFSKEGSLPDSKKELNRYIQSAKS